MKGGGDQALLWGGEVGSQSGRKPGCGRETSCGTDYKCSCDKLEGGEGVRKVGGWEGSRENGRTEGQGETRFRRQLTPVELREARSGVWENSLDCVSTGNGKSPYQGQVKLAGAEGAGGLARGGTGPWGLTHSPIP